MHYWYGWGWGWGMLIVMVVFWALVIAAAMWAVRTWADRRTATGPGFDRESPLDILKKRYARGEIDREEFEQKRRDLEEPRPGGGE